MDKDIQERWVTALRSGEYKQGFYRLRDTDDNYCVIGVLYSVIDPDGWNEDNSGWWWDSGLWCDSEKLSSYYLRSRLIRMNDSDKKSFSEIANYIESL